MQMRQFCASRTPARSSGPARPGRNANFGSGRWAQQDRHRTRLVTATPVLRPSAESRLWLHRSFYRAQPAVSMGALPPNLIKTDVGDDHGPVKSFSVLRIDTHYPLRRGSINTVIDHLRAG